MDRSGHRERLRDRLVREGLEGFAPHEALELLLTYAIPRKDTKPMAYELMNRFGSLAGVLEANEADLEQVPGLGRQSAVLLSMVLPLMRKYTQEKRALRSRVSTYAELRNYVRSLYIGAQNERFFVLSLDAKLNVLAVSCVAEGTPAEVTVHTRLVLHELLRHGAVGAVISHNHPSGSPYPSQADIALTANVQKALKAIDIRLYDHVIIAGDQDYSFFFNHLLELDGKCVYTDAAAAEKGEEE